MTVEPGDALTTAQRRAAEFLERLDHLGIEDVGLVSLPHEGAAERTPAREAAVTECTAAGLGPVL